MINKNGHKLRRVDLDDVFETIQYNSVLVETDIVGLACFVEYYTGWMSAPAYSVDKSYLAGVHPSGVGVQVIGSKNWTGMKIYENIDNPSIIEEITNYT